MTQSLIIIIISLIPLVLAGIIAIMNSEAVNNTTEKVESLIRRVQGSVAQKSNWFSRFVASPILWLIVLFFNWTDGFNHRGLKNGARVAITFYLMAIWIFILYAAFIFIVVLGIFLFLMYIAYKVLIDSNESNEGINKLRNPKESELLGIRGKKIYSGTNFFNEELAGRVDEDGNIYSGTNWLNENKIGRIDEGGTIYHGTNSMNEKKVGRIDEDGIIHKGSNWFTEEKTGRIDEDGNVYKGSSWFNEEKTGRTEG